MALKGDFGELAGFLKKLQKLPGAGREIAIKLAPKTAALVGETMAAQTSPTGEPWPETKSGAPAFGGSSALGHVFSRLVGKSAVRTTVLYPLHFHQDGTRRVGRKRMAAIRKGILGAAGRLAVGLIKIPRKRKDESPFQYEQRVAAAMARKSARKEAVQGAKMRADFAAEQARAASGWHDPPRPMIPDEGDAIPDRWNDTIREVTSDVMRQYGAEER